MLTAARSKAQGDVPPEQRRHATGADVPGEVHVVGALLEAFRQPGAVDHPVVGRSRRPFDVQYWACWAATALFLALLTYLWIIH